MEGIHSERGVSYRKRLLSIVFAIVVKVCSTWVAIVVPDVEEASRVVLDVETVSAMVISLWKALGTDSDILESELPSDDTPLVNELLLELEKPPLDPPKFSGKGSDMNIIVSPP